MRSPAPSQVRQVRRSCRNAMSLRAVAARSRRQIPRPDLEYIDAASVGPWRILYELRTQQLGHHPQRCA
jgi:hypothetical protein